MTAGRFARGGLLALALVSPLAACDGGTTEPQPSPTATLTSNASAGWAYVKLGTPAAEVTVTDAAVSAAWDLGFNATNVKLNGGASGPGGVVAYCLCQNQAATTAEVLAMTAESEQGDFESVRAADIPVATAAGWSADVFAATDVATAAGPRWYKYNLTGNHQISPTFNVYLVKRGSEVYKVQLIGYYGPAGETRRITMRYALLDS